MGMLLTVNGEWGGGGGGGAAGQGQGQGQGVEISDMTVYMNVRYRRPVETPGVVLVEAVCTKREGRKTFVEAKVLGEGGVVFAEADALFVEVPSSRL
jgi:acyl-coenzyme A thioesterase PaaI-like protein